MNTQDRESANKNYKLLLDHSIENEILFRIEAIRDIELKTGDIIKKGTTGGYISNEDCLDFTTNCWVDEHSLIDHCSRVYCNSTVLSSAVDDSKVNNQTIIKKKLTGNK